MAIWEWDPQFDISKQLDVRNDGLTEGGDYGAEHVLDQKLPEYTETYNGRGFTYEEIQDIKAAAMARGGTWSLVDNIGRSVTGRIASFKGQLTGQTSYWEATLVLRRPTVTGP